MSNPIRIAIIGVGKIARDQHVPAIAGDPRFTLVAAVSGSGGIPGLPCFPTLAELIASKVAVDAVALCTPPVPRGAIAREAIAAGLAVMLEKPPTATLAEFEDVRRRAEAAGIVLFATWHSRHAPMVEEARAWLAGREVAGGRVSWREDVRRWHPGQAWLWAPGGLGVFDPGINAFSILTAILPEAPFVSAATLEVPANCHTPIAAMLELRSGGASIAVDLDFRQTGPQSWDIELETACGHRMRLTEGGARLSIDGEAPRGGEAEEYAGLYARFAELIAAGQGDADAAPLRLVADAFLVGEVQKVEPFVE